MYAAMHFIDAALSRIRFRYADAAAT